MCFEYLEALSLVWMALWRILHMKAFTLGIISLVLQTSLRIFLIFSQTGAGEGVPESWRSYKQALYADLALHFPFGVSLQQNILMIIGKNHSVLDACCRVLKKKIVSEFASPSFFSWDPKIFRCSRVRTLAVEWLDHHKQLSKHGTTGSSKWTPSLQRFDKKECRCKIGMTFRREAPKADLEI
jgi:hypothetical protein